MALIRRRWTAVVARLRGLDLGRKLVLGTLAFCAVFTLLTASARTWWSWRTKVAEMNADLVMIDRIFRGQIATSLWELDRDALRAQLASVMQVAGVGGVDLRIDRDGAAPEHMRLVEPTAITAITADPACCASGPAPSAPTGGSTDPRSCCAIPQLPLGRTGPPMLSRAPMLRRTITHAARPGVTQTLGELTLFGDERVLWQRLASDVSGIVLVQLMQSVLLAGLVMWMFNRSVTVHVRRIARHLGEVGPDNLDRALQLERPPDHRDELSLLEVGVNDLQRSLSDYLARQRSAERDLAAHRDRLSELVDERTLELRAANVRLEELARRDALTGLANRRHFDEVQDTEFRRATRTEQPLSVLLCDVDYFKRYNDTYGHAQGDQCLRAVAEVLRSTFCRGGELPARIGGEEFAVLLPGVDEPGAVAEADRLCLALAQLAIPHAQSTAAPVVTVSVGVAGLRPEQSDSFDAMLRRADQALYRAKQGGRNRVAGSSGNDARDTVH